MHSITNLKLAIEKSLLATDLPVMIGHGELDTSTGQPTIKIAERGPTSPGVTPYVGYEVVDTDPIAEDDPTLGYYNTLVFIFVVGRTSPETTRIADYVHSLFTDKPCGYVGRWYFDISDNCVVNKFTKFISRLRFGREGQNVYNHETNTWMEAIQVRFCWTDQGCQGCTTPPPIQTSPPEIGDIVCDC